jgi:NAD(P)H-hydrate epimerase
MIAFSQHDFVRKDEMTANLHNLPALRTDQMIEVDRLMIEAWGITLIQMMENAGRNFAELARHKMGGTAQGKKVAVLCGHGNNGGGGMTAARHLHNWGARVVAILAGDEHRLKDAPAQQWQTLQKMGITRPTLELSNTDLFLDAMLGYGAKDNPRPPIADWIKLANECGSPILSLDSPSGLDTTTVIPGSPCIRAAAIALALPKAGLIVPSARAFVNNLYLADISVHPH